MKLVDIKDCDVSRDVVLSKDGGTSIQQFLIDM